MFMPPTTPLTLVAPSSSSETDPVPVDVRAVIDLFTTHLAKVTFPDVDAASLRKLAEDLRAEAKSVARAREALAAAIVASDARLATLTDATSRAIAYARIYGEAQPERQAILDALVTLERPSTSTITVKKRRGRPPRVRDNAELFDSTPSTETH